MPKKATIKIEDQEYEIVELRGRDNAAWRKRLEELLTGITDALQAMPATEITNMEAVAQMVRSLGLPVLGSIETVRGLVTDYLPDLADVLEDAYDSEIMDAFIAVLGLAFPFGAVINKVRAIGQAGR